MSFHSVQRILLFILVWAFTQPCLATIIALQLPHESEEYRGAANIKFSDGTLKTAEDDRPALINLGAHEITDIETIEVGRNDSPVSYNHGSWSLEQKIKGKMEYTLLKLGEYGTWNNNSTLTSTEGAGESVGTIKLEELENDVDDTPQERDSGSRESTFPGAAGAGQAAFFLGVLALLALVAVAVVPKLSGIIRDAARKRNAQRRPTMDGAEKKRDIPNVVGSKLAEAFQEVAITSWGKGGGQTTSAEDWRNLYDIEAIGKSGGFGDTYTVREKAWWKWRREVLKVLKGNWTEGTWSGNRIWVEQMKYECDHLDYLAGWGYRYAPRILKRGGLLDPVRKGSEAWFTMTMAHGISLKKTLRILGTSGFRDRLRIVKALAKALAELHRFGIAHRDLTPENIFVQIKPWGVHVDLIDFGSAKRQAGTQMVGVEFPAGIAFVGKTSYCAPEHLRNINQAGIPSDDYALGVLSCQVLLGSNPFKSSSSREEALEHHLHVDRWELANRLCREGGVKAEVAMYLAGHLLKPEEEGRGTAVGFLQQLNVSYPFL